MEKEIEQEKPQEAKKEPTPKKSTVKKHNLNKDYVLQEGEEDTICILLTDSSAPRTSDIESDYIAPKSMKKFNETNFMKVFGNQFKILGNVKTSFDIFRIIKNIDSEIIEKTFSAEITSASNSNVEKRKEKINSLLKKYSKIRLNGSIVHAVASDFTHLPKYDKNLASKYPEL